MDKKPISFFSERAVSNSTGRNMCPHTSLKNTCDQKNNEGAESYLIGGSWLISLPPRHPVAWSPDPQVSARAAACSRVLCMTQDPSIPKRVRNWCSKVTRPATLLSQCSGGQSLQATPKPTRRSPHPAETHATHGLAKNNQETVFSSERDNAVTHKSERCRMSDPHVT